MSYQMDLMREISTLCLAMSLTHAEDFVKNIDTKRLSRIEYIDVLGAAAGRIGGCAAYEPALAAAAAARVATRAAKIYDRGNGDQTLVVTKLVTRYLRYSPADYRRGEESAGLKEVLDLWIDVWTQAEAALDPQWRPNETFPPFDPAPSTEPFDGGAPQGIADPALRARYEQYLAKKALYLQRMRDQSLLRRALDEARDDYVAYVAELKAVPGLRPALSAAAGSVADPPLKAALSR